MPSKHKNKNYARLYARYRTVSLKKRAVEYLGGKCMRCGYNKCLAALSFHHRNPEEKEIAFDKIKGGSWNIIIKELDKCDLLCCNCHMEHHWDEGLFAEAQKAVEEAQKRRQFRLPNRDCPKCGKSFKPMRRDQIHCSPECYHKNYKTHVMWPDNLPELVEKTSMAAVARQFGVSAMSVRAILISRFGFDARFSAKRYKIQWPDNLPVYINNRPISVVARELGVSDVSVATRLRRYYGKV